MAKVINQAFGKDKDWAFYNGDCVFVLGGLPEASIDFTVYSPPFAKLYIYSDNVADMGNSADEAEFFEGFRFALRGLHRVCKIGTYHAIHCKDLMRYMSSHGYSGQDDFSGNIIQAAEAEGWTFQRRMTIWKNPVIEMQRTKTYGLLHKSFAARAEVVRVGAPDYVLLFRKQDNAGEVVENWPMPELPQMVTERVRHIWSMRERALMQRLTKVEWWLDYCNVNTVSDLHKLDKKTQDRIRETWVNPAEDEKQVGIFNERLGYYTPEYIDILSNRIDPGRLAFIRCVDIPRIFDGERCGYFDMAGEIIRRFEAQGSWKFHARISLTDGSYLVGFRNWSPELIENYKELNGQVTHNLRAPSGADRYETITYYKDTYSTFAGTEALSITSEETEFKDVSVEYQDTRRKLRHPDYVGNEPPITWHDDSYYSILVWQKYASPVWDDLEGLPTSHQDCWMNINQTNVLNFKAARDPEDEKHICPLQLDLTERLILEYSKPGDVVLSPYGGISSEAYVAVKLGRKAILAELKSSYWKQGVKYLKTLEVQERQMSLL